MEILYKIDLSQALDHCSPGLHFSFRQKNNIVCIYHSGRAGLYGLLRQEDMRHSSCAWRVLCDLVLVVHQGQVQQWHLMAHWVPALCRYLVLGMYQDWDCGWIGHSPTSQCYTTVPLLASVASTSGHNGVSPTTHPHQLSPQIQCLFHWLWPHLKQCQRHHSSLLFLRSHLFAEGLPVQKKNGSKNHLAEVSWVEGANAAGDVVPWWRRSI